MNEQMTNYLIVDIEEEELKSICKSKTPQRCPECGKYIMPCALCKNCDNSCHWKNLDRDTGEFDFYYEAKAEMKELIDGLKEAGVFDCKIDGELEHKIRHINLLDNYHKIDDGSFDIDYKHIGTTINFNEITREVYLSNYVDYYPEGMEDTPFNYGGNWLEEEY